MQQINQAMVLQQEKESLNMHKVNSSLNNIIHLLYPKSSTTLHEAEVISLNLTFPLPLGPNLLIKIIVVIIIIITKCTCFEARTAILYLGSWSGTRTTDLIALNIFDRLLKSSSICSRGHLTGSKIN